MSEISGVPPSGSCLPGFAPEPPKASQPEGLVPYAPVPGRYPYTYSADFVRGITETLVLSRADAAHLLTVLSEVIGFDREAAARALADAYLRKWHPKAFASGIEAATAGATGTGSTEGESAVPKADARGDL
jgi:hypothetical protein